MAANLRLRLSYIEAWFANAPFANQASLYSRCEGVRNNRNRFRTRDRDRVNFVVTSSVSLLTDPTPRMLYTVLSILTLYVLGVASIQLFHVDICLPQKEGRKEIDDIKFINNALNKLSPGIKVIFARKAFDNKKVILVVEVQQLCKWSDLTCDLSERGYDVTVTSLQACTETAAEFEVPGLTYSELDVIQEAEVLEFFVVQFYDRGMNTDQYVEMMKNHFEKDKQAVIEGYKSVCFRSSGELPVTLLYFGVFNAAQLQDVYKEVRNEGKASIQMDLLQRFDLYTEKC